MKVVVYRKEGYIHSIDWSTAWIKYFEENSIEYKAVDLLKTNAIEELRGYDILLWQLAISDYHQMMEARSILYSAKKMGLKVFPDFEDSWHKDDKIAEMYYLQSINAPIPKSYVFYDIKTLKKSIDDGTISFPIIFKLKAGAGSSNVKMVKSKRQLLSYAKRMFGRGYSHLPSVIFKTKSHIQSSHDWETVKKKIKRIPEFFETRSGYKDYPNEKGYVYLQEFIPNMGYDLKVVVVGDKLAGIVRPTRKNDFRASGGGEFLYDRSKFTKNVIETAFEVSKNMGSICMGFDFVVDKDSGKSYIIEMCCGFAHIAVENMGGWYDKDCNWHDGGLNAPIEVFKILSKDN